MRWFKEISWNLIQNFILDRNQDMPSSKRLLDPVVRVGEILFGLIMALTFTCSVSIVNTSRTEVRELLIAALSCNLAWGLVDAIMYLVSRLIKLGRNKVMFDAVRHSTNNENTKLKIASALPAVIAGIMSDEELLRLKDKLLDLPEGAVKVRLTANDFKIAISLFILVVLSTFPVAVPFIFIENTHLALRVSNAVAIVMMFFCGWSVAGYVGFNRWIMSFGMVLLGLVLVVITITLGG